MLVVVGRRTRVGGSVVHVDVFWFSSGPMLLEPGFISVSVVCSRFLSRPLSAEVSKSNRHSCVVFGFLGMAGEVI